MKITELKLINRNNIQEDTNNKLIVMERIDFDYKAHDITLYSLLRTYLQSHIYFVLRKINPPQVAYRVNSIYIMHGML